MVVDESLSRKIIYENTSGYFNMDNLLQSCIDLGMEKVPQYICTCYLFAICYFGTLFLLHKIFSIVYVFYL